MTTLADDVGIEVTGRRRSSNVVVKAVLKQARADGEAVAGAMKDLAAKRPGIQQHCVACWEWWHSDVKTPPACYRRFAR